MPSAARRHAQQPSAPAHQRTRPTAPAIAALDRTGKALAKRAPGLADLRHAVDRTVAAELVTRAQRDHGNAYVARALTRRVEVPRSPVLLRAGPDLQLALSAAELCALQEQKAQRTVARIRRAIQRMLQRTNRTLVNTARLFYPRYGRPPRLRYNAMTLRSDSAQLVTTRGDNASETAYYFYGTTQNNEHRHGPNTTGTIQGNTTLIRGHNSDGTRRSLTDIANTLAHEASHILVVAYGELPGTTTASSFDRYKDEFRAYWIEPTGSWSTITPDDLKAQRIREHLVGRSQTDTAGYPALRNRYWTDAAFKTQVDAHRRPDGFNLSNNLNLDRLFQLIQEVNAGTRDVDYVLMHITRNMSREEKLEAAASTLIRSMLQTFGSDAATRVTNALTYPRFARHERLLNPTGSSRVRYLLSGIAIRNEIAIKSAYRRLSSGEREHFRYHGAALLVFINRQVRDPVQRAAVYVLVLGGGAEQHDAMRTFLQACRRAKAEADSAGGRLVAMPNYLTTALAPLTLASRLALYRLLEDVRRSFVDVLPQPVRGHLLRELREGGTL